MFWGVDTTDRLHFFNRARHRLRGRFYKDGVITQEDLCDI
jgi:hypothetical protein